jgi:hypothetical protein
LAQAILAQAILAQAIFGSSHFWLTPWLSQVVCGAFASLEQDSTSFSNNEASTTSCPSLSLSDHVCADASLLDEVPSVSPVILPRLLILNFAVGCTPCSLAVCGM